MFHSDEVMIDKLMYFTSNRFVVALNFGPDSGEFNIKASYYGLPDQADIAMAIRPGIEGPMKLNKVYLEPGMLETLYHQAHMPNRLCILYIQ